MEAKVLVYEDGALTKVYEGNITDIVVAAVRDYADDKRAQAGTLFGIGIYEGEIYKLVLAPADLPKSGTYTYRYDPANGFSPSDIPVGLNEEVYIDADGDPIHPLIIMLAGVLIIRGMVFSVDVGEVHAAKKTKVEEGSGFILPKQWTLVKFVENEDGSAAFMTNEAVYVDTLTEALRKAGINRPVDYVKAMVIGYGEGDGYAVFAGEPAFGGTFRESGKITGYDVTYALKHEDWKVHFE